MDPILDVLAAVEGSEDLAALKQVVRGAVQVHGYDRILMFSFSTSRDDMLEGVYWAEGHWFADGEAPDTESYVRDCPVTRHVLETDQPFFWTKTYTDRGRRYSFVSRPRSPGLHGLQVPVFGHAGLMGAVCFGGEEIDSAPRVRLALTQLGVTAFLAARNLLDLPVPGREVALSGREREVLQWVASGRRVADIAATLGLSDRTVENHLRRIRARLRVKTTAQAIGAALRSGALQASPPETAD